MENPTANATVITYTIGGDAVYLTDQAPLRDIYTQTAGNLYAWIPGVSDPTGPQRDTIATAVSAHQQAGAKALASEAQKYAPGNPPPS